MRQIASSLLFVLALASVSAQAQTIYWKKDYLKDPNGATIAVASPQPFDTQPPTVPASAQLTGSSGTSATLSWQASSDTGSGLAGYKIYRGVLPVGIVAANQTTFTDDALQPNVSYSFVVVAFDKAGNHSNPSNSVPVITSTLVAPSNLSAAAVSSSQINLTWGDTNSGESGYRIERKTGAGGTYSEIATVGVNGVSYADSGLSPSTTYYYRARAYDSVTTSTYSNEASAATNAAAPVPGNLWLSPSSIAQGEAYTITVSNAAYMTLDIEYYLNGAGPYYEWGWPTLDQNGFHNVWYTSGAAPGYYVFTRIRNTLGGPWVNVTSGANTLWVTATPDGLYMSPNYVHNYFAPCTTITVFNGSYMTIDAYMNTPYGTGEYYSLVQLDGSGQGTLCFEGSPPGLYEFYAIKNSENNNWVSVYDYVEVDGF